VWESRVEIEVRVGQAECFAGLDVLELYHLHRIPSLGQRPLQLLSFFVVHLTIGMARRGREGERREEKEQRKESRRTKNAISGAKERGIS